LQRVSIEPDLEPSFKRIEPDQAPSLSSRVLQRLSIEPDPEPSMNKIEPHHEPLLSTDNAEFARSPLICREKVCR